MTVTFKRKKIIEINNIEDLENFVKEKQIYKDFKHFIDKDKIKVEEDIKETNSISMRGLKEKILRKYLGVMSCNVVDFWLCRGYSEEESIKIVSERQKNNSNKYQQKRKDNPEDYNSILPNQIGYWTKKGFSEEESKQKVKERQLTFSLDTCIEKYGKEEGLKVFEERQKKWITSLSKNNMDEINKKKDSSSMESFKNRFGSEWVNESINRLCYTEELKELLIIVINNYDNINDAAKYISKFMEIKQIKDIWAISNSKVIQEFYNKTKDEIKQEILNNCDFINKNKFGNTIIYSGTPFQSVGEFEIGKFLFNNKIEFEHNKQYPNKNKDNRFKYDFYLPNFGLYVEYTGMLHNKNISIYFDKFIKSYKERLDKKIEFCSKNKFKMIISSDYNEIINKLKLIVTNN